MSDPRVLIADVLRDATRPCITSSFQAECVVLTHMLQQERPDIPVLFLDTVHHFAETHTYKDEQVASQHLNLITLRATEPQPGLWAREGTAACCDRHKVGPLFRALEPYDVWFTALRREQSASRANLQEVEPFRLPTGTVIRRVSPLATWTNKDVWAYAGAHKLGLLPLYDRGYTSIGCEPCTSLPGDPNNPRSGRWQGQKLECGIHIQATDR
jgi:phosphoadenosine phosphosulfate reductase